MESRKIIWILILSIIGLSLYRCKTEEIILHGEISGTVTVASTSDPIQAASVKLIQSNDSTTTGNDGTYLLKSLAAGDYDIQASKYLYGTIIKTAAIIPAKTLDIDFALNAVPVPDFSEKYLDFGLDSTSMSFIISNKGIGEMSYVISASQDWITVHPSMGTITNEGDSIIVTINKTGLSDTIHREKIKIISIVGDEVKRNTIDVLVNGVMGSDLHYYGSVTIGTQTWLSENLNVGTYVDQFNNQTDNGIIEKYCLVDLKGYCNAFGGLYLWDEMMKYNPPDNRVIGETQGICPIGWHIPTENEWVTLIDFLGGSPVAGGKLKTIINVTQLSNWKLPNVGATDEVGFHAQPGGLMIHGINNKLNNADLATFWTTSDCYNPNKWCRYIVELRSSDTKATLTFVPDDFNKDYAYSVRCVKNP